MGMGSGHQSPLRASGMANLVSESEFRVSDMFRVLSEFRYGPQLCRQNDSPLHGGPDNLPLRTEWFQLEQVRTQELILRHLQPAAGHGADVGGAAGAYACWLASRGYQVHLIGPGT